MPVLDEVLAANEQYASSFGDKSELALPQGPGFAHGIHYGAFEGAFSQCSA